jgi:hypothetical protein
MTRTAWSSIVGVRHCTSKFILELVTRHLSLVTCLQAVESREPEGVR